MVYVFIEAEELFSFGVAFDGSLTEIQSDPPNNPLVPPL